MTSSEANRRCVRRPNGTRPIPLYFPNAATATIKLGSKFNKKEPVNDVDSVELASGIHDDRQERRVGRRRRRQTPCRRGSAAAADQQRVALGQASRRRHSTTVVAHHRRFALLCHPCCVINRTSSITEHEPVARARRRSGRLRAGAAGRRRRRRRRRRGTGRGPGRASRSGRRRRAAPAGRTAAPAGARRATPPSRTAPPAASAGPVDTMLKNKNKKRLVVGCFFVCFSMAINGERARSGRDPLPAVPGSGCVCVCRTAAPKLSGRQGNPEEDKWSLLGHRQDWQTSGIPAHRVPWYGAVLSLCPRQPRPVHPSKPLTRHRTGLCVEQKKRKRKRDSEREPLAACSAREAVGRPVRHSSEAKNSRMMGTSWTPRSSQ